MSSTRENSPSVSPPLQRSRTELTIASYGAGPFLFNAVQGDLVTHETNFVTSQCLASVGQMTKDGLDQREKIFLDMSSSELAECYFKPFIFSDVRTTPDITSQANTQLLDNMMELEEKEFNNSSMNKSVLEYIPDLLIYVADKMHAIHSEEKIKQLADNNNWITLEKLLEHKIGSCRHKALFTAYLLAQLIKAHARYNQLTDIGDKVFLIRHYLTMSKEDDSIQMVPHAGVLYITANNNKYFLDATHHNSNNEFAFFPLNDDAMFEATEQFYAPHSFGFFWRHIQTLYPNATRNSNISSGLTI